MHASVCAESNSGPDTVYVLSGQRSSTSVYWGIYRTEHRLAAKHIVNKCPVSVFPLQALFCFDLGLLMPILYIEHLASVALAVIVTPAQVFPSVRSL